MFEKMKGLPPKKKIEYFFQYYGIITAIIIAVVAFVIYWIVHIVTLKQDVASIMVINGASQTEEIQLDDYFDQVLTDCGFSTRKDKISIESGIFAGPAYDQQTTYYSNMKIQTVLAAKTVDVILFDEDMREQMMSFGAFSDIRPYLPEGFEEAHPDQLVYFTDEETGEKAPVAVRVNPDSKLMKIGQWYQNQTVYIGIGFAPLTDQVQVYQTLIKDLLEE